MMQRTADRLETVLELASTPLYQLSTANMELFHTNFLYWLAREAPVESAAVWDVFGIGVPLDPQYTPFIHREWRHLDLVISAGLGARPLILENKIGAIPNAGQLVSYFESLIANPSPLAASAGSFVLLTLVEPMFSLPEPWISVTYRDLIPSLVEAATSLDGSKRRITEDYVQLVQSLDVVARSYDPLQDLDGTVALSPSERGHLRETRLLSLVEKLRVTRFATYLDEVIRRTRIQLGGGTRGVGAGLTNSQGLCDWWIPGPAGRSFGWQIQGGQFRLAVKTGPKDPSDRTGREKLVETLYEDYFHFDLTEMGGTPVAHLLAPSNGRKKWLGYEPDFVYRYARINPSVTWDELAIVAAMFAERTAAYVRSLRH